MTNRDRLIKILSVPIYPHVDADPTEVVADYLIDNDVVPVVHGEWLLDGRCSNCLANPLTTHRNYCPNCGAKMDGDGNGT